MMICDEDLELFIEELGQPTLFNEVPVDELRKYEKILPNKMLEYWKILGWSSFCNGLFWLVNPADYEHILDLWLTDTPFKKIDRYHVFARTAFGTLYVWGEVSNRSFTVHCPMHAIIAVKSKVCRVESDSDTAVQSFFAMSERSKFDLEDHMGKSLFEQALAKLGSLKDDEVYAFEPALIAGGNMRVESLVKLNLDIHLTLLRELSSPNLPF